MSALRSACFFTLKVPIRIVPTGISKRSGVIEPSIAFKVCELLCSCEYCLHGKFDACDSKDYVTNWQDRVIEREQGHGRRQPTRAVVATQRESIKDLVCKASTVAIASGDVAQEYYIYILLPVTGAKSSKMSLQMNGITPSHQVLR